MKKAKKVLLLALCAVLLVGATIAGTVAYLTSTTTEVKNTFTAGNVTITLDEAKVTEYGVKDGDSRVSANKYKLIPGHTYVKDPTIHVDANSEDCWIFAKVVDGLDDASAITINDGWTQVATTDDDGVVYAYQTKMSAGSSATLFNEFTFAQNANPETYKTASITIIGYAVQADSFATAAAAWATAPTTWN